MDDPREALQWVQESRLIPALPMTDQAMPWMSGREGLGRCTAVLPQRKSILCAGEVDGADLAATAVRPGRVLQRSFDTRGLEESVRSLIWEMNRSP